MPSTRELTDASTASVLRLIQADLRNGTPGLRGIAEDYGYRFSSPNQTRRGRNTLRPGQFLMFINRKQTQIIALNHVGDMIRSVDRGRQIVRSDVEGFLGSLGISLTTPTKRSRRVSTSPDAVVTAAAAPAATPAPRAGVTPQRALAVAEAAVDKPRTKAVVKLVTSKASPKVESPAAQA